MFLVHRFIKLLVTTPSGTAQYFDYLGFPISVGYIAIIFEIGGGTLLLSSMHFNYRYCDGRNH